MALGSLSPAQACCRWSPSRMVTWLDIVASFRHLDFITEPYREIFPPELGK
jgi:hypothetical protein